MPLTVLERILQQNTEERFEPLILSAFQIEFESGNRFVQDPLAEIGAEFLAAGISVAQHLGDCDFRHVLHASPEFRMMIVRPDMLLNRIGQPLSGYIGTDVQPIPFNPENLGVLMHEPTR